MKFILTIVFELLISFTVMDYTLGRFGLRDNQRIGVAIGFAVLFTIFATLTVPGL